MSTLHISDNLDLHLPEEITREDNAARILDYYYRTSSPGKQPLNEFKLILVGRGGVGKTTLVHRLVTDEFVESKRTPGIQITQWPLKIENEEIKAHVWDFGGQEIMHGTHRFFMTERALYLVLISGREGNEDRDAEYWLSLIRSFAGQVPIIVVLHKCEDYRFELNRELLRQKYGQDLVFVETDSARGLGVPELRERICALTKNLPGLKAAWPKEWRRFIVETYVHREPKLVWRTGVVLERANCRVLVRGDIEGRTVSIRVAGVGHGRRELLGIVREHFERIHKSYEKLPVTELVPIPGYPNAHVKHDLLVKHERSFRNTIAVEIGDELRDFDVKELLDGVDLPGAPRFKPDPNDLLSPLRRDLGVGPLSVFISYSHKDLVFLDQLRAALVPYERMQELVVWADPLIEPGQQWAPEIQAKLEGAQIVIPLLSNDFIASFYCMEKEMERALARQTTGTCEIVPVVVRACRFDKLPFGKLQAIQPGGKSIDQHEKKDPAWFEVTRQLDLVIARLKKR